MAIYTRTGDKGTTSLIGGERVAKNDLRIEAYGTVDELSAYIAELYDTMEYYEDMLLELYQPIREDILYIINRLMDIEALFAAEKSMYDKLPPITIEDITRLERGIDTVTEYLPKVFKFTLPVGHVLVSKAHICRTVCRRAERRALSCSAEFEISSEGIQYLNRLSDYLYSLSRFFSVKLEVEEILWKGKEK
ncbi:MAG: cob(I)yrinic acid a,c-diamide adenosyltransferase [Rikenellaceae bacterium]